MKDTNKKNSEKVSAIFSSADFWLDKYQEMFSDFDPAPFERRMISEDFIEAVTRRFPEGSEEEIHFRISVPKAERSTKTEAVIVKRLKSYFRKMADRQEKSLRADQKRGAIYFVAGCVLLLTFVWVGLNMESVISQLLGVVFLPLGWFGVWEGTSRILSAPERYQKKLSLYQKLAGAKYEFFSEEELLRRIKKAEQERVGRAKK